MSQTEFRKYILSAEFKQLLAKYESAVKEDKLEYFDVDDLIDIAEYYNIQKDTQRTIDTAKYCLQLFPGDSLALFTLARISLTELEDIDGAEKYLQQIPNYMNDVEGVLIQAEIFLARNSAEQATKLLQEEYEKIKEQESHPDYYFSDLDEEEDKENEKSILKTYPLDVAMLMCDYDQIAEARKWMSKYSTPPAEMEFEYWETLGRIHLYSGQLEDAIYEFNKAIDDDAYSVTTWLQLCDAQYQLSQIDDAMQSAEYVLALDENNEDGLSYKGCCLMEKNRLDEALECFIKLETLYPDTPRPHIFHAAILLAKANIKEGMQQLNCALEKAGWDINILTDIGILLYDMRFKEATYGLFSLIIHHYEENNMTEELPLRLLSVMTDCCSELGKNDDATHCALLLKIIQSK